MARVLVIEDDRLYQELMRTTLSAAGHETVVACDGEVGSAAFRASAFDLVVTDLVMPEKEGMETIRELRAIRPDVPIIAVSGGIPGYGAGGVDYLAIAAHFGAMATLQKPFRPAEFAALVDSVLGRRAATAA